MNRERRSPREIRTALRETQAKVDRDLEELDVRLHEALSLKVLLSRHPALVGIGGAVLAAAVFRRPALVARGVTWIARASVPVLLRALLRRR